MAAAENEPIIHEVSVTEARRLISRIFDEAVKGQVLKGFHAQLHTHAHLLVGHSESIHAFNTGFELLHFSKAMGYRKRA